MEGETGHYKEPRHKAQSVNVLGGWIRERDGVRRRLVRAVLVSASFSVLALLAIPLVVWLLRAEIAHGTRIENRLAAARKELGSVQAKLASTQPEAEKNRKLKAIKARSQQFVNCVFTLVAAAPQNVVLSSVSATKTQNKLNMRLVADAPSQGDKGLFESRASAGAGVLAAFATSQTFTQTLYPNGVRFEFVKIAEAPR